MSIKKNSKMEGGDSSHQIPNHNPQRLHTYTKLANDTRNKLKSMCVYGTEKPKSKKIQFSHSVSGVAVGGMLAEKSGSQARSKKEKPKTADDKNCSHQEKQKVESVKSKKTVQKRKQVIGNCTGAKDVTQKCTKEICFQAGNLEKQKLSNNQPLANADNTKQRVQCFARTQLSAKNTTLSESDDSEDSILPKISRRSRIKDTKTFCNDIKQMPQMAKKHGSKPSQHLDHNVKPSPDKIENPSAESSKDVSKMSNKRQKQLNSFANLTVTDISEEMILEDDSDDDEDDNDDDEDDNDDDDDDDVSLESLCDSSVDHDTESNKAANFSVTVYVLDGDANIECPNPTDFLCSTDIIVSKDCSIEEFDQMMEKLIAEKFPTYTGGYEYDCPYKHVLRSILKGSKFILEEKVEKEDINLGFILQLMGSMYVVLNEPLNPAKIKWASLSSTSESSIISSSTCTPAFSSSSSSSSSSSASHFSKPVIKSKKKHSTAKSSMTSQDCFSGFQLNLDGNPMEGLMLSHEARSSLYNPVDFSRKRKHIEPKVDFGLQEYGTPMTVNGSETYLTLENVVETMMAKINDLRSLWLGPSPKQSTGN